MTDKEVGATGPPRAILCASRGTPAAHTFAVIGGVFAQVTRDRVAALRCAARDADPVAAVKAVVTAWGTDQAAWIAARSTAEIEALVEDLLAPPL